MKLIPWLFNVMRIVLSAIILITVWPTLVGLFEQKITWNQAVDSLFSNWVITLMIGVLALSLLISIFRNAIIRSIVTISAAAALICLVTGTITLDSVSQSVEAYNVAGKAKDTIVKCHLNVAVEDFGGKFRAVVKEPKADRVVGYVEEAGNGLATLVDSSGKSMNCEG